MGGILTQLSETSRAMANQLQLLSDQYNNGLGSSDHANLQRVSHRAARAMHRLASVQNTVFPMLANAAFVGTAPGSVSYRYQPQHPAAAPASATATPQPAGDERPPSQQGRVIQGIPFPAFIRGAGASPVALGMIPSIMAHARASAQSVNAAMAAAAAAAGASGPNSTTPASAAPAPTTPATTTAPPAANATPAVARSATAQRTIPAASVPVPQPGAGPIGQMVLGPNGSLSYTIQAPVRLATRSAGRLPTYATAAAAAANPFDLNSNQGMPTRFMIPADFAGAGFLDFWRNLSGQEATSASATPSTSASASGNAVPIPTIRAGSASSSAQAAQAPVEFSSNDSLSSRRRERPEDFSQEGTDRAASRRRLETQVSQMNSSLLELENRLQHELDNILGRSGLGLGLGLGLGSGSAGPLTPAQGSRPNPNNNTNTNASSTSQQSARNQPPTRPTTTRSSSNDARRASGATESSSPVSSPSPSSPSGPSLSSQNSSSSSSSSAASSAYNLGRIGVFISAILRMVDQPREDGSPRTLADVICNDPESSSTPLQDLVRNVAESITVRETRSIVEGHPAPIRNIHPILNSFIRDRALNGQQVTESNLEVRLCLVMV